MVIGTATETVSSARFVPEKETACEKLVETDAWGAAVVPDAAAVFDWVFLLCDACDDCAALVDCPSTADAAERTTRAAVKSLMATCSRSLAEIGRAHV